MVAPDRGALTHTVVYRNAPARVRDAILYAPPERGRYRSRIKCKNYCWD